MRPIVTTLLSSELVEEVHEASIEVLEQVGIWVGNERARSLLTQVGVTSATGSAKLHIPRSVVESFLPLPQGSFTFYGRSPDYDRVLPQDSPLITLASAAPNVIDLETGTQRRSTAADISRLAQLVQHLPGYDLFGIAITAEDAPQDLRTLSRIYPAIRHCQKPILFSTPSLDEMYHVIRLGEIVAGSAAAYRARPPFTFMCSSMISPLVLEDEPTEVFLRIAAMGLPQYVVIAPIAGLTAPLSLIGSLVQINAEFLAMAILAQLAHAGTPVIYGALPVVADMRTAAYASGGIETGMLLMGCAQMARHYGVPSAGFVGATNAKLNDAQAGYETGMVSLAALLAGVDILHLGGLLDSLMVLDYGKVLIDHEIAMMLKRLWQGTETTRDDMGVDAIRAVGVGGTFIEHDHTMSRLRATALLTQIADRATREEWELSGREDTHHRALKQVRQMLSSEQPALLSAETEEQIRQSFVELMVDPPLPAIV